MLDNFKDKMSDWKDRIVCLTHKEPDFPEDDMTEDSIEDPKNPPPPSKDPSIGSDPVVKILYEGKNSVPGCIDWVDKPPRQVSERVARINDRIAIRVYKTLDKDKPMLNGRHALKYHQLELQNYILIEALKDILKKEDVHLDANENAKFNFPFMPLYFCHEDIRAASHKAEDGTVLKQQLNLLLRVLSDIFSGTRTRVRNLQAGGLISFSLAWTYFPRDSIIYSPGRDCERIYKVLGSEYKTNDRGTKFLAIKCQEIHFDGEEFLWNEIELKQPTFSGNKPIKELDQYPLTFHENPDAVKKRLSARGTRVLNYQGLTYCEYKGLGIHIEGTNIEKHNVEGRVLIDTFGYSKYHLGLSRRGLEDKKIVTDANGEKHPANARWYYDMNGDLIQIDAATKEGGDDDDDDAEASYLKRLSEADQQANRDKMLKRTDDLIFICPMLQGFALKNKLWLNLYVDDVKPLVWNDEAYDHLVYSEGQKDLLLSFVENHHKTKVGMDDVILGKGQGLITLLSGPPGTGKTLTAEAIADKTRRPLLYLQAEDLGIIASSLGENLKKFFEIACDWDAVILLDEADVFMAERNPNDIARNELVSIFLRELEYFRGIIFLTTNLYDTIDVAFRSRVSIHLLFNPLSPSARQILWKKFLDRLPQTTVEEEDGTVTKRSIAAGITEEDLQELSLYNLNGREIKNAIKTVKSWCEVKKYEITLSRMESAIKVTAPQTHKQGASSQELYD